MVLKKLFSRNKGKNDSLMGADLLPGANNYRAYVGPAEKYDLVAANQFNLLTMLGLRENHFLLDIGCGSLRGGRLFIPYLLPHHYFGIEPNEWLVEEGIKNNIGKDMLEIKHPKFSNEKNFTLSIFDTNFDFILAQSIFSHASQNQIKKCLSEAKKIMKPESLFAATFIKGDTNYEKDEWLYPGGCTYTIELMSSLIKEQDLSFKQLNWKHPNKQTWIVIFRNDFTNQIPDL